MSKIKLNVSEDQSSNNKINLNINKQEKLDKLTKLKFSENSIDDHEGYQGIANQDNEIEEYANNILEEDVDIDLKKSKFFKKGKKVKYQKPGKKEKLKPKEEIEDLDELSIRINKEYAALKIKKILMSSLLVTLSLSLLVFGTYNTFFKQEKSAIQNGLEFQRATGESLFKEDGVNKFLKDNINNILKKNASFTQGTETYEIDISSINISMISKKSDFISNVYFSAILKTNIGENTHNFVMPIAYDFDTFAYSPAGVLQLSPTKSRDSATEVKNDIMSFEGIAKISNETIVNDAKTFVDQFFIMVYNQKADLRFYYTGGEVLGDDGIHFNNITEFNYYSGYNKGGYNAVVKYSVTLTAGINYIATSYLNIEPSDKSFIIKFIM